jgi:menaquinone-dependent protoporphyrinogen oxidase
MRVLVVYGSKRGGTEGLARAVGEGLTGTGHTVDVLPAGKQFESLAQWDAVVVGGALYAWFWQRDARRFVRRHLEELQQLPVFFFSSGPLDDSAHLKEIPPPGSVARLARLTGAQRHKTFGGRLVDQARGALPQGDWRNLSDAREWGEGVGEDLYTMTLRERLHVPASMPVVHSVVLGLCAFTGITAIAGGLALVGSPSNLQGPPLELLEHSPFDTFLIPGLLLFLVVGVGNLAAAGVEARRIKGSELAVLVAGAALTGWIVTQLAMIRTLSWLQLVYFLIGAVTFGSAVWLWRVRHRLAPHRFMPPV